MHTGLNTHWEPQPAGAAWVSQIVEEYCSLNSVLRDFAGLLATHTGTRLTDWIDHLEVCTATGLPDAGFTLAADGWYEHRHHQCGCFRYRWPHRTGCCSQRRHRT